MKQPASSLIHRKLTYFALFCVLGIAAFLVFFHHSFSSSLEQEKKTHSKHLAEVGVSMLAYFRQLELSNDLSTEAAQKLALEALEAATYGDDGYFWVNDGRGVLLMQPNTPERVGKSQLQQADSHNVFFFKNFISTAKQGGGWVAYHWSKPGSQEAFSKISYVAYFEPWDWVIGTGLYLDDMQRNVLKTVLQASGILILSFSVFIVTVILIVNYFVNQLEELAVKDHLTGLHTKRFLTEALPFTLKKYNDNKDMLLAAIFIDVDHFKAVNDTYGHHYGDEVLSRLALTIQNKTRPDDLCIRYGGEEFVIVGLFNDERSAFKLAERIRIEVSSLNFSRNKTEFHITISAGVAIYHCGEYFDNTLSRADKKMYQAKENGRNRVEI